IFFFFFFFFFFFKVVLGFFFFFFFQAEDGIRDFHVTGVQTCALPISLRWRRMRRLPLSMRIYWPAGAKRARRSEERRVGKSVDLGGRRIIKKKKKKKKKEKRRKKEKKKKRNTKRK